MSENVIATVFYPKAREFIHDFLISVDRQTSKDFKLIVFNNGLISANNFFFKYKIDYTIKDVNLSPAYARVAMIKYILDKGYKNIIFADCDDILPLNRVVSSLEKLNNHCDIIVNDFNLFIDQKDFTFKKYLSKRIKNNEIITIDHLYNYNMMGLSNTAAKAKIFNFDLAPRNKALKAYDWFLWSKALMNNHKAFFFNDIVIEYRIHNMNVSNLSKSLTISEIKEGIIVKKEHYKELSSYNKIYSILYKKYKKLYSDINNSSWETAYLTYLKQKKYVNPFWWEKIVLPK